MRIQLDVVVWRGSIPESRHRIQAAVCDDAGRMEVETEQPQLVTSFRSSAKPFQCLPLVERGHADRWGFSDEEIAVMCASHVGSAYHLRLVSGILERIGLGPDDLACGYHEPRDADSRDDLTRHPEKRSALYNNCSGKHAGMLCLARSEGWPIRGYEQVDHPLQRLLRDTVADVAGVAPETMLLATDGCSLPTFGMPLAALARAWARLASARPGADARTTALARIRTAMSAFPVAIGGDGTLSTRIMQSTGGRITAKGGAEGLQCVAVPGRGLGAAIKVEDGEARALGPATLALLEELAALDATEIGGLVDVRRPIVKNHAELEVGLLEGTVRHLTPATS